MSATASVSSSSTAAMEFPPDVLDRGTAIGRFVVLGLLGKGGMGEVYAAHDPELDRKVAIKLLRAGAQSESPEGRMRLLREAQAIARVSHPNVVVVYDVGTFGNRVFIAMELVEGNTLRYWMHARTRSWPEVLEVFAAAGRGLAAAHERGLVHRDFKPDNVMIGADGQVRVMDFGLVQLGVNGPSSRASDTPGPVAQPSPPQVPPTRARAQATDAPAADDLQATRAVGAPSSIWRAPSSSRITAELTQTGTNLGTPAYMSPEQFRNEHTDPRTDQFSFCVALYEAVYSERPFSGSTFQELSDSVCSGRVRPEPEGTTVPSWIRDLIIRGLARQPTDRWPAMNALLAELERQPAVASRRRFVRAAAAKLASIWEPPRGDTPVDTPAKSEMQQAFLATGKAYAAKAWQGVSEILDRYTRRWSDLYVEACEATHVRGEQSAEVLDLRMACLEEGRADLAALVRLFRYPTAEVVENAVAAANGLGTLERCENVELLRSLVRPPADSATRQAVERLRAQLAEVRALSSVARLKDAVAMMGPLERSARGLGYLPLVAEVLMTAAGISGEQGGMSEGAPVCEEALMTALACRHEEVAIEAAVQLIGFMATRSELGELWGRLAEALLRRIGGHDKMWGWMYTNRAMVRARQGRLEEALADERLAVAAKEKVLGPEHYDVGVSLGNIAVYLDDLGRLAEAIDTIRRAAEIVERGLGPDHPAPDSCWRTWPSSSPAQNGGRRRPPSPRERSPISTAKLERKAPLPSSARPRSVWPIWGRAGSRRRSLCSSAPTESRRGTRLPRFTAPRRSSRWGVPSTLPAATRKKARRSSVPLGRNTPPRRRRRP